MCKRWTALAAVLLLLLAGTGRAVGGTVTDLWGYPGAYTVMQALDEGWVAPDPDGRLRPRDPIGAGEFAAMLNRALGAETSPGDATRAALVAQAVDALGRTREAEMRDGYGFPFIDAADGYLEAAFGLGLVPPVYGATFRPDEPMTRGEAITLIRAARGAQARSLVRLTPGTWAKGEPYTLCGTPDTRILRWGPERPEPVDWVGGGTVRLFLHNSTNICGRTGETMPVNPEGWQLQIHRYLGGAGPMGEPVLQTALPAPPAELAPGEPATMDVQIGGGMAPGWYVAMLVHGTEPVWATPVNSRPFLVTGGTPLPEERYLGSIGGPMGMLTVEEGSISITLPPGCERIEQMRAMAAGPGWGSLVPATGGSSGVGQPTTWIFGAVPRQTEWIVLRAKVAPCDGGEPAEALWQARL